MKAAEDEEEFCRKLVAGVEDDCGDVEDIADGDDCDIASKDTVRVLTKWS